MSNEPPPPTNAVEVLKASMPDIRALSSLLRSICFSGAKQRATMTINDSGIMVFVEESRVLLGAAWITKELFEEFEYNPENPTKHQGDDSEESVNIVLSFQLNILLECLNIFGTASGSSIGFSVSNGSRQAWRRTDDSDGEEPNQTTRETYGARSKSGDATNGRIDSFFPRSDGKGTGMRLSFAGEGYPLVILLAESSNGPTTTCELVTYDAEPQLDLPLDSQNVVIKCILKSSWLRDALSEVDPTCEKISFIGNPKVHGGTEQRSISQPHFRIQAVGPFGSTEMDYPNDREVFESFECASTVSFSYRFSHITRTLRALQGSSKTSLRIDAEGVLSLQFLSSSLSPRTGSQTSSIVDFRCLSIDEEVV